MLSFFTLVNNNERSAGEISSLSSNTRVIITSIEENTFSEWLSLQVADVLVFKKNKAINTNKGEDEVADTRQAVFWRKQM